MAVLAVIAFVLLIVIAPPGIQISPANGATEVKPDKFLEIGTSRWGASIQTVQVEEAKIAPDGSRGEKRLLDGHLEGGRYVLADGSNALQSDAQYTVTVTGTTDHIGLGGIKDAHVHETYSFSTVTTPMPIIPPDGLLAKYGEDVTIKWNVPVSDFQYQLDGVQSTMRLEDGGRTAKITLAKFEQGKEYKLRITGATSQNGRGLQAPVVTTLKTAPALTVSFDPADGSSNASTQAHPTVIFSEPVSNPDQAQAAVSVQPQVSGKFNWVQPNKLEFVPDKDWDHLQDVTLTVKGGAQFLRGISGGYLENDQAATFTTAPNKSIDVSISTQTVTLLENGNPVASYIGTTGIAGHETPVGDFTIYAKLTATDMRGSDYFVPHVPWVMVFKGDYTIHGNYWNKSFGYPSSHGCVGLPVDIAHQVFEWAPIGTPVHIHM